MRNNHGALEHAEGVTIVDRDMFLPWVTAHRIRPPPAVEDMDVTAHSPVETSSKSGYSVLSETGAIRRLEDGTEALVRATRAGGL